MKGCFSIVLHTHMPYVRKNGAFPVGEDWLYQVMSETYIPLLGMLAQLEGEGQKRCLAITLTPVLCEQLADPYIRDRFIAYLKTMHEHTRGDIEDFAYFADGARKALAEAYREEFRRKLVAFLAIGQDILAAVASFEKEGLVETLASAATHAFLPGLSEKAAREQVLLGIDSHRRHLGVQPKGFWIPECAYREGLEDVLESEGVSYFVVDSTSLGNGVAGRPYLAGTSRLTALSRSDRAHTNAWDEVSGYPADGRYVDSTKYYHASGLHYWRVTGPGISIESKEIYEPEPAQIRALDHAGHYLGDISREMDAIIRAGGSPAEGGRGQALGAWNDPPLVLASYDTEFLGHGWKEGIYWLELTLRSLAASESMRLVLPSEFLSENKERARTDLLATTWGTGRDHSTWVNEETAWMWEAIDKARARLEVLLERTEEPDVARGRELAQAARELLLLESSDWPYMVAKDRASEYAIERFRAHLERFDVIVDALEAGTVEGIQNELAEIEEADRVFADIDLGVVSGRETRPGEGRS